MTKPNSDDYSLSSYLKDCRQLYGQLKEEDKTQLFDAISLYCKKNIYGLEICKLVLTVIATTLALLTFYIPSMQKMIDSGQFSSFILYMSVIFQISFVFKNHIKKLFQSGTPVPSVTGIESVIVAIVTIILGYVFLFHGTFGKNVFSIFLIISLLAATILLVQSIAYYFYYFFKVKDRADTVLSDGKTIKEHLRIFDSMKLPTRI